MKTEKLSFEKEEKSRRLEDVVELLKTETDRGKMERLTKEAYSLIKIKFLEEGGVFYDDINEFYGNLKGDFVVRMEDPERLIHSVAKHEDLEVSPRKDYPNVVEWRNDYGSVGLRDAFLEGTGMLGGMVTVFGFREGDDIEVSDVRAEEKDVFGRERGLVRIAKGVVHPEDLQFIILRMPVSFFPEGEITPQEKKDIQKHGQSYIFRGFAFNESAEPAKEERIAA